MPVIVQTLGGARIHDRGGKRLLSWAVDIVVVLDKHSHHDSRVAVATWRAFADSEAWPFKGADATAWPRALGDWLANGHKPRTGGNRNPAVLATTDRTDRPITAEERQAVIDRQYTRFPNLAPPDWIPPDKRAAASGGAA